VGSGYADGMVSLGYFLSCEEFGPRELVQQARLAEEAGFERLWISDHYHPWSAAQGQSPFVWSVIGALSEATSLPITTAVTCPTVRIHPAVIAQAAATAAVQTQGRFVLGVGSGEALNEHILGDRWPPIGVRLQMLEEAIEVIRKLHTGKLITHRGEHYTVEDAQIYTLPEQPVPIYVSGFGPQATRLAARAGDGYINVVPNAKLIAEFRSHGGDDKPVQAGMKVCYGPDEQDAVATAHRLWGNTMLPGHLGQILPNPRDFEQAMKVSPGEVGAAIPCGPDPGRYVESAQEYLDAGVDELYVQQIGPDQQAFFEFWASKVAPELR
jgi:G6PDH family F420-dependent oxidoreductase